MSEKKPKTKIHILVVGHLVQVGRVHGGLGVICGVAVDVDVGTHVVRSNEQDVLPGRKGRVGKAKEKKGGHSFQDHLSFFVLERTLLWTGLGASEIKVRTDNLDSIIYSDH